MSSVGEFVERIRAHCNDDESSVPALEATLAEAAQQLRDVELKEGAKFVNRLGPTLIKWVLPRRELAGRAMSMLQDFFGLVPVTASKVLLDAATRHPVSHLRCLCLQVLRLAIEKSGGLLTSRRPLGRREAVTKVLMDALPGLLECKHDPGVRKEAVKLAETMFVW